ncbi:hypothetical protein TKK_0015715 [Trichogramma kaykai]|uniref:Uncharacterized protein n=1 Tax=Trichogramma kaykai TaxID=54128 RepID=A0ABD2W7R0_9HYME
MTFYVVDVTGFVDNNNTIIAKELALMPIAYDGNPETWFIKPPYEWEQLDEKTKTYNEFIMYRDGMEWDSGVIEYECIKTMLDQRLKDAKTIFVRHFKVGEWLASYGFHNLCDVSQDSNYYDYNIPICKASACFKHAGSTIMSCATRNVKEILFNVMLRCQ